MNILQAAILGIVEGVTEFLPVSSTAHLEITHNILGIVSSDFIKSFEIAIQLGAILAVILLYRNEWLSAPVLYFKKVVVAFIPTGIVGFLLYKIIKGFLLGNLWIVAVALTVGGVVILWFEKTHEDVPGEDGRDVGSLSNKELLVMGLSQSLAVVPGVSRSLAVILSGRMMGVSKKLVTKFSFLLAIPTMLLATLYDLYKSGFAFSGGDWVSLSVGFLVSFIVAFFVVKWLLDYIKNHSFIFFGYYRIVLGIILLAFLFFK